MSDESTPLASNTVDLATQLTAAWLSNPNVRASAEEVPAFLVRIHQTISDLSLSREPEVPAAAPEFFPAVPVRSSVKPDYIISLIDGRKFKSLKRHLSSHGLTAAEYRERYGLKADYPMVAQTYSARRREVAEQLGLGRRALKQEPAAIAATAPTQETASSNRGARAARKSKIGAERNAPANAAPKPGSETKTETVPKSAAGTLPEPIATAPVAKQRRATKAKSAPDVVKAPRARKMARNG